MRKIKFLTIIAIAYFLCNPRSVRAQFSTFDFKDLKSNALVTGSNAYDFTTSPHASLTHSYEIKNNSAMVQNYHFKKLEPLMNRVGPGDSAYAYFCTGSSCLLSTTFDATVTLNPAETMIIRFDIEEASAIGVSKVNYTVSSASVSSESLALNFNYNKFLSVSANQFSLRDISVFPNPANVNAFLSFNSRKSGLVDLKLYDLNGCVIKSYSETVREGHNKIEIETNLLPDGFYFLAVSDGQNHVTQKIMVAR